MAIDIPAETGTITTTSGTQGRNQGGGFFGYVGNEGSWCPVCKAKGFFNWIEPHHYCDDHPTDETVKASNQWNREVRESWGMK